MTRVVTVSVIIPVWNDAKRLQKCLSALQRQTLSRQAFEIIVVDNGSTDSSPDVARSFGNVRLLTETNPGSYAARNRGLLAAAGHYVAFTDSDCIPAPDWLDKLVETAGSAGEFGIIAGRVDFFKAGENASEACFAFERQFLMRQEDNARKGRCVTANWLSRGGILRRFGGFDASLASGGDYELSQRLSANGLPVIYAHHAVVSHPARASASEITAKTRRITGGRWGYTKSRFRLFQLVFLYTALCAWRIAIMLKAPMPGIKVRMNVISLLIRTWLVSLDEVGRLQFGGRMRRS
jgi:glycosyltransferase involved in cell wall biosynthesis